MIDFRRVPDRWRRLDVTVRDLPFPLLIVAASFVPAFRDHGTQLGDLPARPLDALAVPVILLTCLPLAVRRRWPALCTVLVALGFAADQLRAYHSFAGSALAFALVSAGAHLERRRYGVAAALSAAYVLLAVALDRLGSTEHLSGFATFYLVTVFAWGIGAWLRSTRAAEAERRRRVAEDTRAAERTRIARDLHDVVTHHVTAMVVQAEAARYLTADPGRLDGALGAITDTGRRAIGDLRHLLDVLDPDHGTAAVPSAGELSALVERTRQAGQPVEFTAAGEPGEPAGSAELVAYRVVQESLTNALKYAPGSRTVVRVHYRDREISVEVGTDGAATPAASPGGSGRGLAGLRDRIGALDGDFAAGPGPDGGFVVRARIPSGSPA
ncbi:sensor histidine kinase [Actinomadura parmotrematis]|uniref:histidine kinase n=1 Tax=Actinomadura parmotrematis TaxID=2864039 RepID=A0ABS7FU43_9ACTN|nr:histidine kinase [Actinomadura parmotrematis]MBW8483934.1 two-component sensor histidine kinase [Actinomadura parmotrematis]